MLVLTAAFVAGCSSSSSPSLSTNLGRALDRIADTPTTSAYVEYGDVSGLRATPSLRNLSSYGWSNLASRGDVVPSTLGLDSTKVSQAISVGRPPDGAGMVQGSFDAGAVDAKLKSLNIRSGKSGDLTHWTLGADHTVNIDGPLQELGLDAELDDIGTKSGFFGYASTASGLQSVTDPGDKSLMTNSTISALSDCLGDAGLAMIETTNRPAPIAAGLRIDPPTEVLCVLAPDGDKANQWRGAAENALRTGKTHTGEPWSSLLTQGVADVTGNVVRVTGHSTHAPGLLVQSLKNNDAASLIPAGS